MSDLWNNDDDNQRLSGSSSSSGMDEKDVPGRSHLGSSLIIEGVSPPLAWAESSHPFTPLGDLSSSQRFDMDAIADGGGMYMILGNKQHSDKPVLVADSSYSLLGIGFSSR
jgi:hypothetical protein